MPIGNEETFYTLKVLNFILESQKAAMLFADSFSLTKQKGGKLL
jgi:hypothetical protein